MSLINKMLQELDRRHASPAKGITEAPTAGAALAEHLRPVKAKRRLPGLFWWTMAACMLFAVSWVAWLVWQFTPRPAVTELAHQASQRDRASTPAPAAATDRRPQVPAGAPQTASFQSTPQIAAAKPETGAPGPEMLRLATELEQPVRPRSAKDAAGSAQESAPQPPSSVVPPPEGVAPPPSSAASPQTAEAGAQQAPASQSAPQVARLSPALKLNPASSHAAPLASSGKIDRQEKSSPRERAEVEYRRAVTYVNQGRIAEGMDGFRAALEFDPEYEVARQTLVSLLLEAKRVDDAANMLQQGLAANPRNTAFAILLARIIVERGDAAGALKLLQDHPPKAGSNADYHGFAGALLQRMGQHQRAIEEYQAALKIAPSSGAWWVGLGISQQAVEKRKEAVDAFQRAKSTGNLAPDLLTFVDHRLRLLQ